MTLAVRLVDETPGYSRRFARTLRLASERVTAREIISWRVEAEVEEYNRQEGEIFQGLVQPAESERILNGYRLTSKRKLESAAQVRIAIEAFERNRILMLFDERQIERLDEMLTVTGENTVTFLRLVPLVGG